MSGGTLVRWSGLAAVAGGALFAASNLLLIGVDYDAYAAEVRTTQFQAHTVLFVAAAPLLLLGLVGLHTHQAPALGRLGLVGFVLAFLGTAFALGTNWAETFVLPTLAEVDPASVDEPSARLQMSFMLSFAPFVLGWLLFGAASLRARVLPRWASVLLVLGVVALVPTFFLPGIGVVFAFAVAALGHALFSSPEPAVTGAQSS